MALIVCPQCGKEVSEFAASCPNCGLPKEMFTKPNGDDDLRIQIIQYIENREHGMATWKDIAQTGKDKEIMNYLVKDEPLNGEVYYPKATSDFCKRRANEVLEAEKEFIASIINPDTQRDVENWFLCMETIISDELNKANDSNKRVNARILKFIEACKFVKFMAFALSEADDVLYEWECVSKGKK